MVVPLAIYVHTAIRRISDAETVRISGPPLALFTGQAEQNCSSSGGAIAIYEHTAIRRISDAETVRISGPHLGCLLVK